MGKGTGVELPSNFYNFLPDHFLRFGTHALPTTAIILY